MASANVDNNATPVATKEQITTFYEETQGVILDPFHSSSTLFNNPEDTSCVHDSFVHDIEQIVGRPFPLGESVYNTSQSAGTKIIDFVVKDALMLNPQVERKFDYFLYGDLHPTVEIRYNVQPTQQGLLICNYLPAYEYKTTFYNSIFGTIDDGVLLDRSHITNYKYALIDLRTNDNFMMNCPYYSPYPMFNITNGDGSFGRFIISVFNPLRDISADGFVSISIVIHTSGLKLHFPTSAPTYLSAGMTFQDKLHTLNYMNKLSPGLRNLLKLPNEYKSPLMKTIPYKYMLDSVKNNDSEVVAHAGTSKSIAPPKLQSSRVMNKPPKNVIDPSITKMSDVDSRAIIDQQSTLDLSKGVLRKGTDWIGDHLLKPVLDWFGLCHDRVLSLSLMKQQLMPGVNNYNGPNETHVMGLDQTNIIEATDLLGSTSSSFEDICDLPIYITTINWNVGDQPTTLYTFKIDPYLFINGSRDICLPRWSMLSSIFEYMYADYEFVITVICTGFHNGRFSVEYEANNLVAGPPTTNLVYKEIFDLSAGANQYSFNVPYKQNCIFLTRPQFGISGERTENTNLVPNLNGTFQLNSYTSLKTMNNAPQSIDINIFLRLKNVQFLVPNSPAFFPVVQIPPPPPTSNIVAHSGDEALEDAPTLSQNIPEEESSNSGILGAPAFSLSQSIPNKVIGEHIVDVKGLLQRYSTFMYTQADIEVPANSYFAIDFGHFFCLPSPATLETPSLMPRPTCVDMLDLFVPQFLGYAGSIEFNIQIPGVKIEDRWTVSLFDKNVTRGNLGSFERQGVVALDNILRYQSIYNSIEYNGLEGVFNGTIPYYSNRLLRISDYNKSDLFTNPINCNSYVILISPPQIGTAWTLPAGTRVRRRFGSDLKLGPYLGPPRFILSVLRQSA